jgi:hypothetical protein
MPRGSHGLPFRVWFLSATLDKTAQQRKNSQESSPHFG